jgi:hypothetical protein
MARPTMASNGAAHATLAGRATTARFSAGRCSATNSSRTAVPPTPPTPAIAAASTCLPDDEQPAIAVANQNSRPERIALLSVVPLNAEPRQFSSKLHQTNAWPC